jgi:hypothetical protein
LDYRTGSAEDLRTRLIPRPGEVNRRDFIPPPVRDFIRCHNHPYGGKRRIGEVLRTVPLRRAGWEEMAPSCQGEVGQGRVDGPLGVEATLEEGDPVHPDDAVTALQGGLLPLEEFLNGGRMTSLDPG